MKRLFREVEDSVKARISNTLRNKPKTPEHKAAISKSMFRYWQGVPSRHTTMADLIGKADADKNNESVPSSTLK